MLPISLWLVSSGCTGKEEPVTNAAPSISIINPADGDVWTEKFRGSALSTGRR